MALVPPLPFKLLTLIAPSTCAFPLPRYSSSSPPASRRPLLLLSRAMPHIKTFTRYSCQNIAWFLLTSSNLSKAAWGALQKNNYQLMIRSYELGVLFMPSSVKYGSSFSCTNTRKSTSSLGQTGTDTSETKRTKFVTLACQVNSDSRDTIQLPMPYELPPKPYSSGDVPWSWDRRYTKKDVYGQVWPSQ